MTYTYNTHMYMHSYALYACTCVCVFPRVCVCDYIFQSSYNRLTGWVYVLQNSKYSKRGNSLF